MCSMNVAQKVLELNREAVVLWIYTRADLKTEHFIRLGCDLERIICVSAFCAADLFLALDRASHLRNIRLVVIDNIAIPFMNVPEPKKIIRNFGQKLRALISVVSPALALVTNYCYEDEWMPPMLGETWSEHVDQRIQIYFDKKRACSVASLAKCSDKEGGCKTYKGRCIFSINSDLTINSEKIT